MAGKIHGAPGFCINTEMHRPPRDLMEKLARFPVAIIGDLLGRRSTMDAAIKPINPERRFCGPALTIEVRSGDNLMAHAALAMAKAGDVLVIDAHADLSTAIMGGLMAHSAAKIGVAAVVIDGALRDRDELFGSSVAFFCRGISPCGPDKDGPGQINMPISCGGVAVQPGDIIVGDSDGIVVVPQAMAGKAIEASAAKSASERKRMEEIDRGEINQAWLMPALRAKGLLKDGESL